MRQDIDVSRSEMGLGHPWGCVWGLGTFGCMPSVGFQRLPARNSIFEEGQNSTSAGGENLTTHLQEKNSADSRNRFEVGLGGRGELVGSLGAPPNVATTHSVRGGLPADFKIAQFCQTLGVLQRWKIELKVENFENRDMVTEC